MMVMESSHLSVGAEMAAVVSPLDWAALAARDPHPGWALRLLAWIIQREVGDGSDD
ncbi:MAG: hypothetical protein H7Z39_05705 [Burkholderiaceae bacterium]|nr:hypothetical protein [Burkholderiaceae bacterium]